MNTKAAIEFLKCIGRDYYAEAGKEEIMNLLKRGEKFEQMWGELENCLLPEQYKIVEIIEQKYFPKIQIIKQE